MFTAWWSYTKYQIFKHWAFYYYLTYIVVKLQPVVTFAERLFLTRFVIKKIAKNCG